MRKRRSPHEVDQAVIFSNAAGKAHLNFALTLNKILYERQIDQDKMADDLGIASGTLSNYRNGKNPPKLEQVFDIAEYLKIDLQYLLTGARQEHREAQAALPLRSDAIENLHFLADSSAEIFDTLNALLSSRKLSLLLWGLDEVKDSGDALAERLKLRRSAIEKAKKNQDLESLETEIDHTMFDDSLWEFEKDLKFSLYELSNTMTEIADYLFKSKEKLQSVYDLRAYCSEIAKKFCFDVEEEHDENS